MGTLPKPWAPYQNYAAGTLVTYGGLSYQALQAETSIPSWDPADAITLWAPVASGSGATKAVGTVGKTGSAPTPWVAGAIYTAGMMATVNGVAYQANWWTQGNDPVSSNGPSGSGEPWTLVANGLVPAPPVGLAVSAVTSTDATLQWQASAAPANQIITGYAIFENGVQIATSATTRYKAINLAPATTYAFAVAALDAAGASAESTPVSMTTATAPTGPGGPGKGSVPAWSASAVYTAGMIVTVGGSTYQANWWTQGSDPTTNSDPAGSGKAWTLIGGDPNTPGIASVPQNLVALGTSGTGTVLTWTASAVFGNGKVTGYEVYENGHALASTTNTSFIVTGLTPGTTYGFSVAAEDAAGESAPSGAVTVATVPASTGNASHPVFMPYIDMSMTQDQNLAAVMAASGVKNFTLAFLLSSGPGQIGWGGVGTIADDGLPNGSSMLAQVQAVQAAGGDVAISFGGANGTEPALVASSAAQLQAEYQSVITRYGVKSLDFDIEGGAVTNTASLHLRDQALVGLRAANPGLTISLTLPVLPTGLDANGLAVLRDAKADGLNPDVVNIMAMDYGPNADNGAQMGVDAISAALNTIKQVSFAGLTSKVGVTPMIGVNDDSAEVFSLADAQALVAFADSTPQVARLAMWSMARDNGSGAGHAWASPTDSGLAQGNYQFASIFRHA